MCKFSGKHSAFYYHKEPNWHVIEKFSVIRLQPWKDQCMGYTAFKAVGYSHLYSKTGVKYELSHKYST